MSYLIQPLLPSHPYFSDACALYLSAMPKEERRELPEWKECFVAESAFKGDILLLDNQFAGFATYWQFDNFLYVEHLAIREELRGNGLGQILVQHLKDKAEPQPLLLEAEPATTELAIRRLAFYERQGIVPLSYNYLQPPYRQSDKPFPLLLLTQQKEKVEQDIEGYVRTIYLQVYCYIL